MKTKNAQTARVNRRAAHGSYYDSMISFDCTIIKLGEWIEHVQNPNKTNKKSLVYIYHI